MTLMNEVTLDIVENTEDLNVSIEEEFVTGGGTQDYRKLKNKPTLNGLEIVGNVDEIDPTVSQWAKEPTKPSYTADEVGALKNDEITSISLDEINRLWEGV